MEEKEGIERVKFTAQELDETCPKCGKHKLQIKFGKMGRFVACADHPGCGCTRNVNEVAEKAAERIAKMEAEQVELDGHEYPKYGGRLVYKYDHTGSKLIGYVNYSKCRHVESLEKPKDTGAQYPQCRKGNLAEHKSRYDKLFYGCNTYLDCNYATRSPPAAEECPNCHWPVLTTKATERWGTKKACP